MLRYTNSTPTIPKSDCCTVIETGCAKPTTITKAGVVTEPLNTDKSNLSNTYENKAVKISVNSSDIISIESNSFSVHNVPSDGECFFHALSLGTVGNFTNSNTRQQHVPFINMPANI